MKNGVLTFLFNKIYNNGELISIIVTEKNIKKITNYYKENFEIYSEYASFHHNMGSLSVELAKSKFAMAEYQKQFQKRLALQPAILSECFISQTLANKLDLDEFIDADEKVENVPAHLLQALIKAKGGELESAFPRYIYYSNRNSIVLLQYGDSSSIDAVFVKDGYRIRLEIKEEKAKLGEYDLNYDEKGKLIATKNIIQYHPQYQKIINCFNNETSVFDHLGKNFKIGSYLDSDLLDKIVENVFNLKKIDLYIFQSKDKIFSVPAEQLLSCVDVNSGSEIRTAGRNSYKVFTPSYLLDLIRFNGGTISDDIVNLNYKPKNVSKARGKKTNSRYQINSLFFVKIADIMINNDMVSFSVDKIKQNKATISVHLYAVENKDVLKDVFRRLNF